ncbi:S1/P1 nuclease [uncultured Sphingomonas sp.]|uniref:S1/P1 nuclease n=1 Tax=uncultured Sphingomonas sp. TaxID=158754 RepID=UPI00262768DF|nr:S1/P1 nuclease [uncultured Sphingomonas sp.]
MRIRSWAVWALSAAALGISPGNAVAWSNQGHMVTGAIAHDDLAAANPALIATIVEMMTHHPDKARFERALAGYSGAARDRRLFEMMARWPDDARDGPYDHPGWHYWLRLIPSRTDPANVPPAMLGMTTGEAAEAYRLNLATVRDPYAPAADRAVSLCWLFHLAGDIQQPLHAGHLISGRFPLSDRAGTNDFVRPASGRDATTLHAYWDNVIGGDNENDANVEAVRIRLEQAWPRSALKELSGKADPEAFRTWADESYELARTVAYVNGSFEGATTAAAARPVPAEYAAARQSVGERRVALGGHRIADALRAALAN